MAIYSAHHSNYVTSVNGSRRLVGKVWENLAINLARRESGHRENQCMESRKKIFKGPASAYSRVSKLMKDAASSTASQL